MATLRLMQGGREFQVGCELLKVIAENLPCGGQYGKLAEALIDLGIPSVTDCLLDRDGLEGRFDELWDNGDPDIRKSLLQKDGFIGNLTDAQARDIIDADNVELLKTVAALSGRIVETKRRWRTRLSRHMANTLMRHIVNHPDVRVRETASCSAPLSPIVTAGECLNKGFVLGRSQLAAMRLEDVRLLEDAPVETLESVSLSIDEILDERGRMAVARLLADHPDPLVRLAAARNDDAPRAILEELAEDEDGDVACAAKKSLDPDWEPEDDSDWDDPDCEEYEELPNDLDEDIDDDEDDDDED